MKSYTNLEQSKRLAEILPLKSADMHYERVYFEGKQSDWFVQLGKPIKSDDIIPCWSLTALLKYLSEIKPMVYTPVLFPSEGKWILQFAEYGHGNVCELSCGNPIDACVEMIIKLHERKML